MEYCRSMLNALVLAFSLQSIHSPNNPDDSSKENCGADASITVHEILEGTAAPSWPSDDLHLLACNPEAETSTTEQSVNPTAAARLLERLGGGTTAQAPRAKKQPPPRREKKAYTLQLDDFSLLLKKQLAELENFWTQPGQLLRQSDPVMQITHRKR